MQAPPEPPNDIIRPMRKPRADGQRNRERLLQAAKLAFTELGTDIGLDEIARRADVGIGTLYRHFPTRDAIVEAVYRREVEQLAGAAESLLASMSAGDALQAWMRLCMDYVATKTLMATALAATVGGGNELREKSGRRIIDAMLLLVDRAMAVGDIRRDVEPADLLRALRGFTHDSAGPHWQASVHRLVDILMDGLRVRRDEPATSGPSGTQASARAELLGGVAGVQPDPVRAATGRDVADRAAGGIDDGDLLAPAQRGP